jgi:hypothetical protein
LPDRQIQKVCCKNSKKVSNSLCIFGQKKIISPESFWDLACGEENLFSKRFSSPHFLFLHDLNIAGKTEDAAKIRFSVEKM